MTVSWSNWLQSGFVGGFESVVDLSLNPANPLGFVPQASSTLFFGIKKRWSFRLAMQGKKSLLPPKNREEKLWWIHAFFRNKECFFFYLVSHCIALPSSWLKFSIHAVTTSSTFVHKTSRYIVLPRLQKKAGRLWRRIKNRRRLIR